MAAGRQAPADHTHCVGLRVPAVWSRGCTGMLHHKAGFNVTVTHLMHRRVEGIGSTYTKGANRQQRAPRQGGQRQGSAGCGKTQGCTWGFAAVVIMGYVIVVWVRPAMPPFVVRRGNGGQGRLGPRGRMGVTPAEPQHRHSHASDIAHRHASSQSCKCREDASLLPGPSACDP